MKRIFLLGAIIAIGWIGLWAASRVVAFPNMGHSGVLPQGTDFGGNVSYRPLQILTVEAKGSEQSFLIALGNLAFSSPEIFGGVARKAGLSCATCHINGDINPRFFIPGLSDKPGNMDVTNSTFQPKADDGLFNPLNIPSLRGLKRTAPYGRDGRFASLREFTRNVIVNEFDGPEPSPLLLDALVDYQRQFEFLPTPNLLPDGQLSPKASASAKRGERIFRRPFPGMDGKSCASCHIPSGGFIDKRQHNVGTGADFDTPTLLNIKFTAPYFHDGRFSTLRQVVDFFDGFYRMHLTEKEKSDLTDYVEAIGDGNDPFETMTLELEMDELRIFVGMLDRLLTKRIKPLVSLVVHTVNQELREIQEKFFPRRDRDIRGLIAEWVVQLRRVETRALEDDFEGAKKALQTYRRLIADSYPKVQEGEGRSLYNKDVLARYVQELQTLARGSNQSRQRGTSK